MRGKCFLFVLNRDEKKRPKEKWEAKRAKEMQKEKKNKGRPKRNKFRKKEKNPEILCLNKKKKKMKIISKTTNQFEST